MTIVFSLLRLIIIAITFFVVFSVIFFHFFQEKLIYYPVKELESTPDNAGVEYEDVYINTADNIKIHAWYIPAGEKCVVFCHGNGGNNSYYLDRAVMLKELGISVLLFDYRGYGRSEGELSEDGTYIDAEAAYSYVRDRGYSEEDIVIWGWSLGGAVAAGLASERPASPLVLESTFTSLSDIAFEVYPFLRPLIRFQLRYRYNTAEYIRNSDNPLMIMASPEDEIVPFYMGKKLSEIRESRFVVLSGGHNDSFLISRETIRDNLIEFLKTEETKKKNIE
ncbi:MAG: alpha/beta hydrolase [Candidatus Muiribacteriaceae bacterium]